MILDKRYKNISASAIFLIIVLILIIVFFCFASLSASFGYEAAKYAENAIEVAKIIEESEKRLVVIIDAGHGGEDPGAVANGLNEKDLNLEVAKKLADLLALSDLEVVMTRDEDCLLYSEGQEGNKKAYDLKNRLSIIESSGDCVFVSIHMNKFHMTSLFGLQTFYSENDGRSRILAESIQSESKLLQPDNSRKIKPEGGTIYILEHSSKPAVLVECGFLSNYEEAMLLSSDEYQDKLAFVIYLGIMKYVKEVG